MKKIVIDNVIEAIHYILKRNGFEFTDKQISRANEYIVPFISEVGIDESEFKIQVVGAPKLASDRRIMPLLFRYFAFIEDNIPLYEELIEVDYSFADGYKTKFFALDKILTGKFKMNEYKNLLLKNENAISSFYYSIRGLDKEKKGKFCKEFSDIVHIDHTTLNVGHNDDTLNSHYSFLTRKNIEYFGKEFLLKISKEQRKIINDIGFSLSEEDAVKIKELFTRYPLYNSNFPLSHKLLYLFTADEINSMSLKDYVLYSVAINNNVVTRMKEILKLDPSFDCPKNFIKEEIFRVLSNEDIVELSDNAKEKIASLSIPEIQNVLVMPFKKINGIVLLDKANRKIDSIKNNHSK